jgi:hypothetical protein
MNNIYEIYEFDFFQTYKKDFLVYYLKIQIIKIDDVVNIIIFYYQTDLLPIFIPKIPIFTSNFCCQLSNPLSVSPAHLQSAVLSSLLSGRSNEEHHSAQYSIKSLLLLPLRNRHEKH